jgi:eukaryotic-like serine/threonine-protein kinase
MIYNSDRNLLFGILTYQNGFIDRETLVAAMSAWVHEQEKPLGDIFVARGDMRPQVRELIDGLVEAHVMQNAGDASISLVSLNAQQFVDSLRQDSLRQDSLRQDNTDDELFATLASDLPMATVGPKKSGLGEPRAGSSQRFEIVRAHAEGGLGIVYAAQDLELNRLIALKQIKDPYSVDDVSLNRFIAEAEITGGLEHPGIVPVYSLGVDHFQRPFYAMRLIRGESLKQAIDRYHATHSKSRAPMIRDAAFRELLDRFVAVCNALAYAHNRGVIHRDLKPANIMLGPFGETLVVDWGLAKALGRDEPLGETLAPGESALQPILSGGSASSTMAGAPMGTPAYMSPEQAVGDLENLGRATDIYGLGATLYSILTGKPPVDSKRIDEAIRRVKAGDIPPASVVQARVPRGLDAVCRKAMRVAPEKRYESALDLAADVQRWLADEPVSAYRDPVTVRVGRSIRKHRTAASVAVAVLVVGLISSVAGSMILGNKNAQLVTMTSEAELRLDQAMKSYNGYISDLLESVEAGSNVSDGLMAFMLEKPRSFFESFAAELSEKPNPSTREIQWLGVARYNLGVAYSMLGRQVDALEQYEMATVQYEKLIAEAPSESNKSLLWGCLNNLAVLHDELGQPDQALQIYEQMIALNEQLIAMNPEEAKYRFDGADVLNNQSRAMEKAGKVDQAAASMALGIERLEAYGKENPEDLNIRYRLATGYSNLAVFQSDLGLLEEADTGFSSSIIAWDSLVSERPEESVFHNGLAIAYLGQGQVRIKKEQSDLAIRSLQTSIEGFERLVQQQPLAPEYQQNLMVALGLIANAARNTSDYELALNAANRSIEVGGALLEIEPGLPMYLAGQASGYHARGLVLKAIGEFDESIQAYKQAAEIRLELVNRFPAVPLYRNDLGGTYLNLANVEANQQRYADAVAGYQQAILHIKEALNVSPESSDFRTFLATAYKQMGRSYVALDDPVAAAEAFLEVTKLYPKDPDWLFDTGCELAAIQDAGENDEEATEKLSSERVRLAIELLQRALASGWDDENALATDPRLDAIRDDPAFPTLP